MPSPSPSLEYVHATASVYKRFESWLKRACKNYGELLDWKVVVDNVLRRERAKDPELDVEQRAKVIDALEEYDKLDDSLLKLAKYKAFDTFGWTGENFIKWVGDEVVSVGYSGLREGSRQYWLSDISLTPVLPMEKKARDVLGFYGVERLALLRIPRQDEAESELLDFLEDVKKWPRGKLGWVVKTAYPLADHIGGFWSTVRHVVELEGLKDVWEDILEGMRYAVTSELKKEPEFQVLKTILMSEWEAERYVEREVFEKVKSEFIERYSESTEDPAKVKAEFYVRAKQIFSERTPAEARIIEVHEALKPLIPAEKFDLTRAGLWKAIRWAFLHPQISVDSLASNYVFPLTFTTEEARAIASSILGRVTGFIPPRVVPPPIEYVEVRMLEDVPGFVGADMRVYHPFKGEIVKLPKQNAEILVKQGVATYELKPPAPPTPPPVVPAELPTSEIDILKGVVHMKAEEMKIEWRPELWDEFWREYEARARELWATKEISFIEEEVEDVLRVVGLPLPPVAPPPVAPPPKPPPPALPPEKRPLIEVPEQVRELTSQLEKETYSMFLGAGLPDEEYMKHRGTIGSEIRSAIDLFGTLLKLEAEEKVRDRVVKFVSDLIEKVKVPAVGIPPVIVPFPAVEIVYAPREKPLSEEELKALQEEILGMPYNEAVDKYLTAITEGRTADVETWRKKFADSSEAVKMKRRVVKG